MHHARSFMHSDPEDKQIPGKKQTYFSFKAPDIKIGKMMRSLTTSWEIIFLSCKTKPYENEQQRWCG